MARVHCKRGITLLFFLLVLFQRGFADGRPRWKVALETLTEGDRHVLELFFRTCLQDSYGGYVIFGEKPICAEGIHIQKHRNSSSELLFFDSFHRRDIYLKRGYEVWGKLSLKSPNYLIKLYEEPIYESLELIIANKTRARETVKNHQALFQYVLGPKITPESLIQTLENSKEPLYAIIKNDRVLAGILLGYGTENALRESRCEYIEESLWGHEHILPLRSGKIKEKLLRTKKEPEMEEPLFFNRKVSSPSFAFSTLSEEKKWLKTNHNLSLHRGSQSKKPVFPWFGYWDSKESEKILASYIETQVKLAEILDSDHFLEKVFERLFNEKDI